MGGVPAITGFASEMPEGRVPQARRSQVAWGQKQHNAMEKEGGRTMGKGELVHPRSRGSREGGAIELAKKDRRSRLEE